MNLLDGPVELMDCDETFLVVRQGRQVDTDVAYVDGIATAAHAPITFGIAGTIQPMNGKDLLLVPEAYRERETLWLWATQYEFNAGSFAIDNEDIVLFSGKAYQVQAVENWASYSRCMLVAIDQGAYAGIIDQANLPEVYTPTA